MSPEKIDIEPARAILAAYPGVEGAWLFGSARFGRQKAGSDIDIGVLFESAPSLSVLADLAGRLEKALGSGEVDLVDLSGKSSILRFEALSGERLVFRNPARVAEFQSLAAREYEHDMAMVRQAMQWRRQEMRKTSN